MRVIDTKFSLISFWQQLVFTEAALLAHPDTTALAGPFTQLLDEFQALHGGDLATRRALLQSQARAVIADQNLDDGVRKLHSDTLSEVVQDRDNPIFRAVFDSDLAATLRFALARQLDRTRTIISSLSLTIVPPSLRAHVGKLQAVVDAGVAVLEGKRAAAFERTEANLKARAWKDDVNALRLTTYGALLGTAAKSRRPKSWVESFFMQAGGDKDDVDIDADPAEPVEPVAPVEPAPTPEV